MAPSPPDIAAAKRGGLNVDFKRLAREGDGWLTPEDRYALKTYGVCAQVQPGVFMIRTRVPGGQISAAQLRHLAHIAGTFAGSWLHLTTRQSIELHSVTAQNVPAVLAAVEEAGLSNRSACGHTMRNVMACPDAGVGLDEPFDCLPDARLVAATILARSAQLNCVLPSRVNLSFGGCPECAAHARINDGGFESRVVDGRAGYRVWAGGSLGTMPVLAMPLVDFVPRADVVAAAEALVDVFVAHGDLDTPKKGRMKFVVERIGADAFRAAYADAFDAARLRDHPLPPEIDVPVAVEADAILRHLPVGGWGSGIRPQRTAGVALVTVNVPLGDLDAVEARGLASLAEDVAGGSLFVTRNQNLVLRDVPVDVLPAVRDRLDELQLSLEGADRATDVRACTGSAVCSLAITAAPAIGARLARRPGVRRNGALRVNVSGCPNSCAQHQAADIGLSGAKVRVRNKVQLGYHMWFGADIAGGRLGELLGRVAEADAEDAVDALIGTWEALRTHGETVAATLARVGAEAFSAHLASIADGFEAGAEPNGPGDDVIAAAV